MKPPVKSSVLAATAAALAIAGCGGGGSSSSSGSNSSTGGTTLSASAYSSKLKSLFCPLGSALQKLGAQASAATTPAELENALKASSARFESTISALDKVTPPSDAAPAQKALIGALSDFKDSIDATEKAVEGGNKQVIKAQVQSFQADAQTFKASLTSLKGQFQNEGVTLSGGC